MHDGAIVFKTKIDNSDVQKDLDKAKREIEKSQKTISETETARLPLLKEAERLKAKLQEARQELAFIKDEQAAAQAAIGGPSLEDHLAAYDRLPALNAAVDENQKKVEQLEKEWAKVTGQVEKYDRKIDQAKASLEEQKDAAGRLSAQLTKGGINMSGAMEKAQKSAAKFKKRLASIVSQVFVFTLVSKALQGITQYMGKALKSNKQFTSELAKLKGALLTAFQPIYEFLVPVLMALMRIATSVVTAIARVASLLGGKSMSQYAKSAEALYDEANAIEETGEAAKKAQRSLAGFDEINQLSAPDSGSAAESVAASADFSAFDGSMVMAAVDELVVYLSGALLVIGIILAFSGVNIPLGVGLMAAGAIGLGAEAATNWDTVRNILKEQAGLIAGISAILLVIGIILVCTGVGIPLGIALIVAGAAGLVTVAAVNWSWISDMLKEVWKSVTEFWDKYIAPVFTAKFWLDLAKVCGNGLIAGFELAINGLIWLFESLINLVVDGLNLFVGGISAITGAIGDLIGLNLRIPKIPRANLGRVSLPRLAQGAVIPPNKEFLAVLGDQTHGTNIEAPLSTIQEAVAEVMADYEAANLAGHEATVAALREILAAVLGIEVGDTTIGQAANRYNQKMAIIKGGY